MTKKRITMIIQDEILRLKKLGHSQRKISKILGINKDTVGKYIRGNDSLPRIMPPPEWTQEIDWTQVYKDVKTVPKTILYEELSENYKLPSYQAFCQYIKNHPVDIDISKISLRIYRSPGESMEVDYSGDSVEILNPATGEIYRVELFVGALSYSSDFYAEFTATQKLEDFISSHNNMFRYFGGVTKYIIPDNCKTAVTKTDKYDPSINKTYYDMCKHYGISVDPADSYSPKHKPTAEKSVHIIQQDFFPRIRNKTYTSLLELNRDLHEWLAKKREMVMKARGNSRKYFYEKEKDLLRPLPSENYEIFYFKKAKVHMDCHFQYDRNFYSVPYKFVGKELDIKFNNRMIHAFYNTEIIVSHSIPKGHSHYITNDFHYPEEKVVEMNLHLQQARNEASKIGIQMNNLIEKLIKADKFPLKNLRKVQGILKLKSNFSKEALEEAARLALEFNRLTYRSISGFAKHYTSTQKQYESAPIRDYQLTCLQGGQHE